MPNGGSMAAGANNRGLLGPAVAVASCCSCLSCAADCNVRVEHAPAPLLHAPLEDTAMPVPNDCMPGHGIDDALEPASRSACVPVADALLEGANVECSTDPSGSPHGLL